MQIRTIAKKDFAEMQRLMEQVHQLHAKHRPDIYSTTSGFDAEYFESICTDAHTIALVAHETEHALCGFCIVTLRAPSCNRSVRKRKVAYLEDLCVDVAYQKRGIGKALLLQAKLLAKQRGAQVLEGMVWSFNDNAMRFYEAMGMTPRSVILEQKL